MARFDWYQATVRADVREVRDALAEGLTGGAPSWVHQRPRQGYGFADVLKAGDDVAAQIWWGGVHAWPHVVLSGEEAQLGAEVLRARWPDAHTVSRVDSCIDYAEPGAYDRLQGMALQVAAEQRVRVDTRGDHLVTMKGRTVYLGAPTSHTRLRIYDKAEQLRAQFANDPQRLATVPDHLARFECQVRPHTPQARQIAARADAITVMGASKWMRVLMGLVAGLELEPFQAGRPWRQSDDDRAYAALLSQYGGLLKRIKADLGSWECVGLQLGHDLAERQR
jgi:hypothetical protein